MKKFLAYRKTNAMKALLSAIAVSALLAGCARPPIVTGSIDPPADYRDRHPIVVDTVVKDISIYPMRGPGGLNKRQVTDIRDLADEYRSTGRGHIRVLMPSNAGKEQSQTLSFVRKELAAAGIPAAYVRQGHYDPSHPTEVSPVRIEYDGLAAKVASQCGKWEQDVLDGGTSAGFNNRQYDNFGCSYQSVLAAQVADPADLSRPRAMGEADIGKRAEDVTQLRNDTDPTTKWSNDAAAVGE